MSWLRKNNIANKQNDVKSGDNKKDYQREEERKKQRKMKFRILSKDGRLCTANNDI